MTDREAAFAALGRRIGEAHRHHDLGDLLSADALREAGELMGSTDVTGDLPAALMLRMFYLLRFKARPAEAERDEMAEAVLQAFPGDSQLTRGQLGILVCRIYESHGDRRLLRVADALLQAEVAAIPAGDSDRPNYLNWLCRTWQLLFECSGEQAFLFAAVAAALEALYASGADHPDRAWMLSNLGNALCSLAEQTGETAHLAGAVRVYRAALTAAQSDSGMRAAVLCNLGNALCMLARRTGDTDQLTEAVQVTRAAADASTGGASYPAALSNLGIALQTLSRQTGDITLLAEAADAARESVAAAPAGHPARVGFLAHLGDTLRMLFDRTGDIRWLTEAAQVGRAAVDGTPSGHHHRAGHLAFLGMAVAKLSEYTADASLLEESVVTLRAAAQAAPADAPVRVACLSELGSVLQTQFDRNGDLSLLSEAVDVCRQAVEATARESPERPVRLSHLGAGLQRLYEHGGDTSLLLEAVNVKNEALAALPERHSDRALYLSSLGSTGMALYERTGSADILEETIRTYQSALAVIPDDHRDRGMCLSNLSRALRELFKRTRDSRRLVEAIQAARDAVDVTAADDYRRGVYLTNLAVALQDQFGQAKDAGQAAEAARVIREAVQVSREAVRATGPLAHPHRAVCLRSLGWSLVLEAAREHAADVTGLGEACRCYLQAATCTEDPPLGRIESYEKAIRLAGPWIMSGGEILALAEAAVELLSQLAPRSLAPLDRQRRLTVAGSLAALAAATAVSAGCPGRAVELLEQTRGLLVAEAVDARTSDLSQLRERFPDLAAAFEDLRIRLEVVSQAGGPPADDGSPEVELRASWVGLPAADAFKIRRETHAAWKDLIGRIRALPGFAGFLAAPRLDQLTEQARNGAVVYLYASPNRSDALILTGNLSTPVKVVPLPDLTQASAEEQADRLVAATRATADPDTGLSAKAAAEAELLDILAWLWDTVTGPVLTSLGHARAPGPSEKWSRVWWCPVGVLACFPLHAAGHHRDPAQGEPTGQGSPRTVMDRVISSYSMTVRALAYARAHDPGPAADAALVIAVPDAPDVLPLPGADAEAALLAAEVPGSQILASPTREAVLAALPRHRLVHFACHSYVNWHDPAASRLVLYDHQSAPLTVSDISALRLAGGLAYLSACETALTTPTLPDEGVHMTGAFHLAGYQHVIGTLWLVSDAATSQVAGDFYRHLTGHGAHPPDFSHAARALHHAVSNLRGRHPGTPSLWAGHTHTGI